MCLRPTGRLCGRLDAMTLICGLFQRVFYSSLEQWTYIAATPAVPVQMRRAAVWLKMRKIASNLQ